MNNMKESYNKEQCTCQSCYPHCELCSHICQDRYKDFKEKGIKMCWIDRDGNLVDY